jgi:very-short-patch-repair endonuclease
MLKCELCSEIFENNRGGQLTSHLRKCHSISLEEYKIKVFHNDVVPKCGCGCGSAAPFVRGEFKDYIYEHKSQKNKIDMYLKLNGHPKCLTCGAETRFNYRGGIVKYCSTKCIPRIVKQKNMTHGFCNPLVQEKIRQNTIIKYGVDNISKTQVIKDKISELSKGKVRYYPTTEHRQKMSNFMIDMWKNQDYKISQCELIKKSTNTVNEKLRRRNLAISRMVDGAVPFKGKSSKLHIKIREYLNLSDLGFVSEYNIGPYIVDEINTELGIVIEINGDYVHANPNKYSAESLIRLRGTAYMSIEKWKNDEVRTNFLVDCGYCVFVIWESDDLDIVKKTLLDLVYRSYDS